MIKTCGIAKLMLVKVILIFTLFLNKPILFFNFVQAMMMRWSEGVKRGEKGIKGSERGEKGQ